MHQKNVERGAEKNLFFRLEIQKNILVCLL